MVILVPKLGISLFSKLENHHHHHDASEALSASLQAFRSDVSNRLHQLSLNSLPGLEFLSLVWIQQCFELLPIINKAFVKLLVAIDYPISKWEGGSIDEYLNYTLNLLELLNSISSSLSHLSQARLSLSHALSLIKDSPSLAMEKIREVRSKSQSKDLKLEGIEEIEKRICSGKEWVVREALLVLKATGLWICGIVLSGLRGDVKPYMEMKNSLNGSFDSSLRDLDSSICKEMMEKRGIVKETKEINDAISFLVSAIANGKGNDAANELQRRLEVLEKVINGVGVEGDRLFSDILAGRNELLESLRSKSNRKA